MKIFEDHLSCIISAQVPLMSLPLQSSYVSHVVILQIMRLRWPSWHIFRTIFRENWSVGSKA